LLAAPAAAHAAAPYGEWIATGIDGDPVTGEVTLVIAEDGINGTGGCNRFFGTAAVDGNAITFGGIGSTRMLCFGEGVMEQESAFFAALGRTVRFEAAGNEMTLLDEAGVPAVVLTAAAGGE